MPIRDMHREICRAALGEEYDDVNEWMDAPVKQFGRYHRSLRHNLKSLLSKYGRDYKRVLAGMLHIIADEVESEQEITKKQKRSPRKTHVSTQRYIQGKKVKVRRLSKGGYMEVTIPRILAKNGIISEGDKLTPFFNRSILVYVPEGIEIDDRKLKNAVYDSVEVHSSKGGVGHAVHSAEG